MVAGIIGLGLMGGSLGLALKEIKYFDKILGYDHNIEHQKEAIELNLIDKIVNFEELKKVDILFLAVPVDGIIKILKNLRDIKNSMTIIDLGSTKEKIINSCPKEIKQNLIPAHPMTGTEKFGPSASVQGLYKDKIVVLCDLESVGDRQRELSIELFEKIGMKIIKMPSHEHDIHAAFISHLPHAISYALANTVLSQENPESILALAAGGFRDMSRIAKSNPDMWTDIFKQNRTFLLQSIELFEKELSKIKSVIQKEEWDKVHKSMKEAGKLHKIL